MGERGEEGRTDLLEELRRHTQHHAAEVLLLAALEERAVRCVASDVSRCADAFGDDVHLGFDLVVVLGETSKGGNDGVGFFVAVAGEEPAGRFGEPDHADDDYKAEDDLEGDGEAPCSDMVLVSGREGGKNRRTNREGRSWRQSRSSRRLECRKR